VLTLTIAVFAIYRRFYRLTAGTKKERLDEAIGHLADELQREKYKCHQLEVELAIMRESFPDHLQKLGLVRYNPFKETGGNQSFSLALINGRGSGLIITSLHNREGTRLYSKPIRGGSSQPGLSREEQEALKLAGSH